MCGLLYGCQIDRQTLRQAESVTQLKKDATLTCPINEPTACAQSTAFSKLYASSQMSGKNQMLILDHGISPLFQ